MTRLLLIIPILLYSSLALAQTFDAAEKRFDSIEQRLSAHDKALELILDKLNSGSPNLPGDAGTPTDPPVVVTPPPPTGAELAAGVSGKTWTLGGQPVVWRGANAAVYWGTNATIPSGSSLYDLHKKSLAWMAGKGANFVRIVAAPGKTAGNRADPDGKFTLELVEEALRVGMTPMLEMHNATGDGCDTTFNANVKPFWFKASTIAMLKAHPRLVVNPANECNFSSVQTWESTYVDFIKAIRATGVKNLIVLDSEAKYSNSPVGPLTRGSAIRDADPLKQTGFSVHVYQFWQETGAPSWKWNIGNQMSPGVFAQMAAAPVAIMIGEFGMTIAKAGGPTAGVHDYTYDVTNLLAEAERTGLSWVAWAVHDKTDRYQFNLVNDLGKLEVLSNFGQVVVPIW